MNFRTPQILGLAASALFLIAATAPLAPAAGPSTPGQRLVPPAYRPTNTAPERRATTDLTHRHTRMPGSDWWKIYPWSPYNAWRNPYWYPPYNSNYPYPPDNAYSGYSDSVRPLPPLPPVPPLPPLPPLPFSGGASGFGDQ